MKDPASLEAQHEAEHEIEAAALGIETAVFLIICKRLRKLKDDPEWRSVYSSMPADMAAINAILKKGGNKLAAKSRTIIENMAKANDEWAARYYKAADVKQVPAMAHDTMRKTVTKATEDVRKNILAVCRTSVVGITDKERFIPIEQTYREAVLNASKAMINGEADYITAINETARKLSSSGLKVYYRTKALDAAGNVVEREKKVIRSLYATVRTNTMDAYKRTMMNLRISQGKEFGADGVEVSAHPLCAPDHIIYQGEVYTYEEWAVKQFEPARPLIIGGNCGHTISPVRVDVARAVPQYSKAQIAEMRRNSEQQVSVKGLSGETLTMSRYEATQYQRSIERSIRDRNEKIALDEALGLDTTKAKQAVKQRTKEYKRITSEAGLKTRIENTRAYVAR